MSYNPPDIKNELDELSRKIGVIRSISRTSSVGINLDTAAFGAGSSAAVSGKNHGVQYFTPQTYVVTVDGSSRRHIKLSSAIVIVNEYGTNALTLHYIDGTFNNGQYIMIRPLAGKTLTLKKATTLDNTTGNLYLDNDVTLNENEFLTLIFMNDLGTGGGMYTEEIGSSGGGVFANTALSNLNNPTTINQDLTFGGGMGDSGNSKNITNVKTINFSSTGGASNLVSMGSANLPSTFHINLGTQTANLLLYLGSNNETNLQLYGSPSGAQAAPFFRLFTQRTPTNGMLCGTYSFDGNDDFTTQQQFVLLQGIARNKNRSLLNLAGALDIFVWSQNNTSAQTKVATFEGDTTNLGAAGGLTPGLNMNSNQIFGISYLTINTAGIQQFNGASSTLTTTSLNLSGSSNLLTNDITDSVHTEKGFTWQIGTFDILQILNNHGFVASSDVGYVNFTSQNVYTSATAGTHAIPGLVKQFLIVLVNGSPFKIPLFGI